MADLDNNPLIKFDRRFIIVAVIIGVFYALVSLAIWHFLGQEIAGIVGAVLTALAISAFKRFETIRFRTSSTTTIEIPTVGTWLLILLTLAYIGAEIIVATVAGAIVRTIFSVVEMDNQSEFPIIELFFSIILAAKVLAYFATAYCAARVIVPLRYSQSLIAGFAALICSILILILQVSSWLDGYS